MSVPQPPSPRLWHTRWWEESAQDEAPEALRLPGWQQRRWVAGWQPAGGDRPAALGRAGAVGERERRASGRQRGVGHRGAARRLPALRHRAARPAPPRSVLGLRWSEITQTLGVVIEQVPLPVRKFLQENQLHSVSTSETQLLKRPYHRSGQYVKGLLLFIKTRISWSVFTHLKLPSERTVVTFTYAAVQQTLIPFTHAHPFSSLC